MTIDNGGDDSNGDGAEVSMGDAMAAELQRHDEEMANIMDAYGVTPGDGDGDGEGSQQD
jgi:hypothetical protein